MLGSLRGTTTATGLAVRAVLHDGSYPTGERVSDAEVAALNLTRHDICPTWNYTLRPRSTVIADPAPDPAARELVL
jgi:hypothetical protein